MIPPKVFVELHNVSVKAGTVTILSDMTWALRAQENWAVLGNNGAGKTTFLSLVRGDVWPAPGCGHRYYRVNGNVQEAPLGFRENTATVSSELLDVYRTMEWNLKGIDVVLTGFDGTPLLSGKPDETRVQGAREMLATLGITHLADRQILGMSHGEAKKILIARAMVRRPHFLFLDEVDSGLDSHSHGTVMDLVQAVVEQGTQVMMATHAHGRLPSFITHAVRLQSGSIGDQGPVSESYPDTNTRLERSVGVRFHEAPQAQTGAHAVPEALIRIENADVVREGKRIIRQIAWTVNPGENWALLGKNGSGKTTLLKLVVGDLRPVWGGKISRFGLDDLQSIWEIRRRISLVTPDMQAMHVSRQTGMDMVLSGFFGSVGLTYKATDEQIAAARTWFERLGLQRLEQRRVDTLSYGQVRALLVLRAVVTNPTVLLLDEALAGLDREARARVMTIVEEFAGPDTCVVFVTHDQRDLSYLFDHVAVMDGGSMVFQGARSQWNATYSDPWQRAGEVRT